VHGWAPVAPGGVFNDPQNTNRTWPANVRRAMERIRGQWNTSASGSKGDITLNYHAGGIHFHGIEDEHGLQSKLAQHHAKAVEKFQQMLAEASYRRNRATFDGARAV
jgi:hypothetical protein